MRKHAVQYGFTLIELMIVVAIIAILAAIAIPAYQNFVVRAQVTEGMTLAAAAETAVWDFYANTGYFPASNQSADLADDTSITGKYVSQVKVTDGVVTATFNDTTSNTAIHGDTLVLSPTTTASDIMWTCNPAGASNAVAPKYLPSSCRH
ncbi:MAG: pilin [Rhodanobacteraceae bacterium]